MYIITILQCRGQARATFGGPEPYPAGGPLAPWRSEKERRKCLNAWKESIPNLTVGIFCCKI